MALIWSNISAVAHHFPLLLLISPFVDDMILELL